jgi:hypothetical protein
MVILMFRPMEIKSLSIKIIAVFLFIVSGNFAFSQMDFAVYNMRATPSVVKFNPAAKPYAKVNVGIPGASGIGLAFNNSGFQIRDLYSIGNDDSVTIEFSNAISKLKDVNFIGLNVNVDLFNVGFSAGNNYFNFIVTEHINTRISYPKDLLRFVWEGNGNRLGERISFDGLGFNFMHYREYALGYSRRVSYKLSVGARFKYLYGLENIYTKSSKFGITTDPKNYALTFDGGLQIQTAGLTREAFEDLGENPGEYMLGRKNTGYGLDLGAIYNVTERISLSASVLDIGRINWNSYVKNYTQEDFSFVFSGVGLDLFQDNQDSATASSLNLLVDSITSTLKLVENSEGYSTPLPTRFYIGGAFNLTSRIQAGITTLNEFNDGYFRSSGSAFATVNVGNQLSLHSNYSIYGRSFGNIGAGFSLNIGFIQIYAISDNIVSFVNWQRSRNAHVRVGLNLTFGRDYENL